MSLIAQGEVSAFAEVVAEYKDRLVNYFYATTGDRHASEDLAQEVFIRIFRKADSFRSGMPFEPWLFRIARNLVIDYMRKNRRREENQPPDRLEPVFKKTSMDSSLDVEEDELGRIVRAEIHKMPEKLRSALVLCELEGFSYETAADILSIRPKALGSRLKRARDYLKDKFKEYRL